MSWDKDYKTKCDGCGKYCIPYDEETPFGCSSYDPPEPLDPSHYCKECSKELLKIWRERFKNGERSGYYHKSNAEMKAAEEYGLKWIGDGIGILGTRYFIDGYRYVNKKLYDRISKLPYWGWCLRCGSERRGSYCSNKKCENSLESKKDINLKLKDTVDDDKDTKKIEVANIPF